MAYLGSKKIKVFPSIGRDSTLDADAELMNEGNISNIVRSLCRERKSYVLSKTFSAPFEFVIYGFYFKITDVSTLLEGLSDDKPLYAHIVVNKQSGVYQLLSTINPSPTELKLDQETSVGSGSYEFRGIVFNNSATYTPSEDQDVGNVYTLQLLDSNSKVPVESRLFYRTSEILGSTNTFGSSKYINEYFETISTNITDSLNVGGQSTLNGTVLVGPENSRTIVSGNVITTDNVKTLIIEGTGSDPKLTISGSVKSVGTLDVIGATTISDTLDVVKATTLNNTLTVSKASTTLSDTTINGTLDVIGNAVLGKLTAETTTLGSIDVTGEAKLQGAITASSTLTVSGDTTLNGILIAGNTKLSSLTVSGDTTLNGINPKITGNDLGTSSLRWTLYADSINTSGDIIFPEVSSGSTYPGIQWSGRTDNASIYYSLLSSDQKTLNFKLGGNTSTAFNFIVDDTSSGVPDHKVVQITDNTVTIDADVVATNKTISASTFSGNLNGEATKAKSVDIVDNGSIDSTIKFKIGDGEPFSYIVNNVQHSFTTSKLSTPVTISLSGDVAGSTSFDGGSDVNINTTIENKAIEVVDSLKDYSYDETLIEYKKHKLYLYSDSLYYLINPSLIYNLRELDSHEITSYNGGNFQSCTNGEFIFLHFGRRESAYASSTLYKVSKDTLKEISHVNVSDNVGYYGNLVSVGDNLYFIGGSNNLSYPYEDVHGMIYKVDPNTLDITPVRSLPKKLYNVSTIVCGTDVYILSGTDIGRNVTSAIMKFNTLNNDISILENSSDFKFAGISKGIYHNDAMYICSYDTSSSSCILWRLNTSASSASLSSIYTLKIEDISINDDTTFVIFSINDKLYVSLNGVVLWGITDNRHVAFSDTMPYGVSYFSIKNPVVIGDYIYTLAVPPSAGISKYLCLFKLSFSLFAIWKKINSTLYKE